MYVVTNLNGLLQAANLSVRAFNGLLQRIEGDVRVHASIQMGEPFPDEIGLRLWRELRNYVSDDVLAAHIDSQFEEDHAFIDEFRKEVYGQLNKAKELQAALSALELLGEKAEPVALQIYPGIAKPAELAALFYELSKLYRMMGGTGIEFVYGGSVPVEQSVAV